MFRRNRFGKYGKGRKGDCENCRTYGYTNQIVVDKSEKIDTYYKKEHPFRDGIALLREIALTTEADEDFKWSIPVYTVNGKNVFGICNFKTHFWVWFFNRTCYWRISFKVWICSTCLYCCGSVFVNNNYNCINAKRNSTQR